MPEGQTLLIVLGIGAICVAILPFAIGIGCYNTLRQIRDELRTDRLRRDSGR